MKIRLYPNEVLREKAIPVTVFDKQFQRFVYRMEKTLRKYRGLGLSATQVGVPIRVIVVNVAPHPRITLVNPHITSFDGAEVGMEGCLSLPGYHGNVQRPVSLSLTAYTSFEKVINIDAEGLLARAIMHEMDHMRGVLICDTNLR